MLIVMQLLEIWSEYGFGEKNLQKIDFKATSRASYSFPIQTCYCIKAKTSDFFKFKAKVKKPSWFHLSSLVLSEMDAIE